MQSRTKKAAHLPRCRCRSFLWKVSLPVDESLEENLPNLADEKPLPPVNKLSKVFSNVDDTHLHIVVGRSPVSHLIGTSDSPLPGINCLVHRKARSHIFPAEIATSKTVGALKDAIKEKKQLAFQLVDADALVLWKVSLPADESLEEIVNNFDAGEPLSPLDKLSKVFYDEGETHL